MDSAAHRSHSFIASALVILLIDAKKFVPLNMATIKKATGKKAIPAKKAAVKKKRAVSNTPNYLTKRILASAAKTGFSHAASATLKVMGYNVIVYRGWVVKKFKDGRIERIKKLDKTNTSAAIVLD